MKAQVSFWGPMDPMVDRGLIQLGRYFFSFQPLLITFTKNCDSSLLVIKFITAKNFFCCEDQRKLEQIDFVFGFSCSRLDLLRVREDKAQNFTVLLT